MRKIIGNMGLMGFKKGTVKINLYLGILLFLLISIGVVCAVTYVINRAEKASVASNPSSFAIAGAGSEGISKTWEGK